MSDPGLDLQELQALLSAERHAELGRRLDPWQPAIEDDTTRLPLLRIAAELARRGQGPPSDLALLARRLIETGDAEGPAVAAAATRLLFDVGARSTARGLLASAEERWSGDGALALAREQLESGVVRGRTRLEWDIERMLGGGDLGAARERLEQVVAAGAEGPERRWALLCLSDLLRAGGDEARAGDMLLRAAGLRPEADRAVLLRLTGLLCQWAGGAVERALTGLRGLRDATAPPSGPDLRSVEQSHAHCLASEILATLDRDPALVAAGPRWIALDRAGPGANGAPRDTAGDGVCPGVAMASLVLELSGRDGVAPRGALPSMAHLRRSVEEAGLKTLRLLADEARVEAALGAGALLVVEEERPSCTGFLLVLGYDPVARLLRLRDPRRLAPLLRTALDQWRRSALHGRSALLVLRGEVDPARLAEVGLVHDERLDLVDRCDLDPSGRVPSQARVTALAEEAIAAVPELPALHQRHGESLVGQMRMGNIAPAPAGPFERWLSATRVRFPEAEWPFQIYAAALEAQGRYEEAGIAWSDATLRDIYDERNFIGQAGVLAQQGQLRAADRMLRRALTLRPGHVGSYVQRAEIAVAEGQLERATLAADLAADLAPTDVEARLARITVSERRGELEDALERLVNLVDAEPDHVFARVRLLRRRVHRGEWDEADRLGQEVCALAPGAHRAWETAAWVARGAGDGERAHSLAMTGLQRCGPEPGLLATAVETIATQLEAARASAALDELAGVLSPSPQALLEAASALSRHGWYEEGFSLAQRAQQLLPSDPNPTWRAVQILLSDPRRGAERRVDELLEQTAGATGGYPFPRIILAWRCLERSPARALELLEEADAALAPAPVWFVQARALEALGRGDDARRVITRLPELFPAGVLQTVGLLRLVRLFPVARGLLEHLLVEQPDNLEAKSELGRTLVGVGDPQAGLRLLLEVEERDADLSPPDWLLDAAEEATAWDVLIRVATTFVDRVERDSTDGADVWPVRARRAAARFVASGDDAEIVRLRREAGRHPGAVAAAAGLLVRAGRPTTQLELAEIAPGALRRISSINTEPQVAR